MLELKDGAIYLSSESLVNCKKITPINIEYSWYGKYLVQRGNPSTKMFFRFYVFCWRDYPFNILSVKSEKNSSTTVFLFIVKN